MHAFTEWVFPDKAVVLKSALILLVIYFGLYALVFFKQRTFMYFPDKNRYPVSLSEIEGTKEVTVKSRDNLEITGWFKEPAIPGNKIVIFFHGNGSNHAPRAGIFKFLTDSGYGLYLASYRGYAGNPGKPSEQGLYNDARAQIDWLINDFGVDRESLVIYGESLGSGVAVQMATEYSPSSLILDVPFSSLAEVAAYRFPLLIGAKFAVQDKFESYKKIGKIKSPVLILLAENDFVVPTKFGKRLFDYAKEPKEIRVFKGAGHMDIHSYGANEVVLDFLDRVSKSIQMQ